MIETYTQSSCFSIHFTIKRYEKFLSVVSQIKSKAMFSNILRKLALQVVSCEYIISKTLHRHSHGIVMSLNHI